MKTFIHTFTVFISLFTATGVFIHDGRIDRSISSANSIVKNVSSKQPALKNPLPDSGPDPHTHPTHTSAGLKGFAQKNNPNPSYPPREQKMKKYLQQNIEPRGRHAFDNHHLPVVE